MQKAPGLAPVGIYIKPESPRLQRKRETETDQAAIYRSSHGNQGGYWLIFLNNWESWPFQQSSAWEVGEMVEAGKVWPTPLIHVLCPKITVFCVWRHRDQPMNSAKRHVLKREQVTS